MSTDPNSAVMDSARVSSSSFGHVYRPDLDGLRAVAVVPVLLNHLAFPGLPGGFVGVDVFFVLSGFFITSQLLEDLKAGRFRLATFYERRARRILPALFVVLAAVTFASVFVLLPADLAAYSRSLMATLLFASNIYFLRNAGYFDADSELNPLLHTWSLSVEEQFYIFFPIALWLAFLVARRHLALLLIAALVVSFALAVWASGAQPSAGFYLPPTRAWELLIGSVLATGVMPMLGTRWIRDLLGLLGLLAIGLSVVLLNEDMPFPGWLALAPCLGAGVIIWTSLSGGGVASRLLATGLIVYIGKISYSLYLWHWPLVVFFRYSTGRTPSLLEAAILFAASVGLAAASLRSVEQPFRGQNGLFSRLKLVGVLTAAGAALGAVAVGLHLSGGIPNRFPTDGQPYPEPLVIPVSCFNLSADQVRAGETCALGNTAADRVTFAVWGDSHASRWAVPLSSLSAATGQRGLYLTRGACAPVRDIDWPERGCRAFNEAAFNEIIETGASLVYLSGKWADYAEGQTYPAAGARHFYIRDAVSSEQSVANNRAVFRRNLLATIESLTYRGIRVVLIGPAPEIGWDVPRNLARRNAFDAVLPALPRRDDFLVRQATVLSVLQEAAAMPNVQVLRPDAVLCADICAVEKDAKVLYFDDNHLSSHGVSLLTRELENSLATGGGISSPPAPAFLID